MWCQFLQARIRHLRVTQVERVEVLWSAASFEARIRHLRVDQVERVEVFECREFFEARIRHLRGVQPGAW